ncbi:hypothetical protein GGS24DRAFT_491876 [Hypoxylon argillaceum]|nr:hypothetical protein GGS24DRAFT_491876 [Hypoxylon argillaceum]
MAAVGLDVGYVATHLGMPETNLSVAISDPTADLVNAILAAVATKAHEFDTLFSQKLQLEVELEASVRSAEAQRDASNETAKKALKDVEDTRQKLNKEETTRQALENELQSLKSSTSTSQSDIDTLHSRIASLETSNRESLSIIDTKNSINEGLSQELQAQHQKNLKLSQEITALQQTVQNANAVASSAKIREQGLQRQLEAAKRDVDWTDQELKKKSAEALNYRKEKGARIAELQRQTDDATSTIESLKRGEQQLRQRLQDAQRKADDALAKVQQLEEAAARREEDFQQQVDRLQRLLELTEQQNATQKNRLHAMEERETQVKRECEENVQRISKELASLNMDREELAQANESLQAEIGRLEAIIASGSGDSPGQPGSAPQTPRPLNGSIYRPNSPFATPGSMRKSISATQALDEYYKVKGQLNVEKQRSSNLAKDLEDELYAENERLQSEIKNMSHLSDESFRERDTAKKAARKAESAASQAQAEITILRNQLRDLGAQGLDELSIEETLHFQKLERGQRLVKNEKLLQVTHELGQNMETVEDHKERIRLQQELDIFRDTLRERDMFRRILESRGSADELASALGHNPQDGVLASIETNPPMDADEFDDYQQIEKLSAERNSQLSLASERFDMLKSNYSALENENKELQRRNQAMSGSAAKQDIRTQNVAEELVEAKAVAEKNLWQDIQDRISRDNENLLQEKSRLNGLLATHQTLQNERELGDAEIKRRLQRKLAEEHSQKRIDELTANLGQIREELVAVKTSRDHLQSRRVERLHPRPTPRPGSINDNLKRELDMTKSQLENAQGQELERLNSAQEQYTQEMDKALSTKDATIKELEQRAEDLSSELSRSNADITRRFEEEKNEEHYISSSQFHQQDLRAQAEIAATAQQAYENEVMKHGETAKALSAIRNEYNQLKTSATLMQSESSWDERRQNRWEDANAQNKILHQQLENVTTQISALQSSRRADDESLEMIAAHPSSSDGDKYRELSNYLRREKEILEVQLQQQLELKLEQERRSHGQNDRNSMAHKDLMSKLEELNLFPRQSQAQLTEKIAKITELESAIQPLEAQIEELQSQQSFKDAEMKQLQEDRDRWQKHPAEVEELKQKVEAETPLQEKIQELEKSITTKEADWAVTRERLITSAKERSRVLTTAKNQVATSELASTREELGYFKRAKSELEEQILEFKQQVTSLQAKVQSVAPALPSDSLDSQVALSELQTQLTVLRSELESVSLQKASIEQELQNTRDQLSSAIAEKERGAVEAHTQTNGSLASGNSMETRQDDPTESTISQPLSDEERKKLEDQIAASEARATAWEAKAQELEQNQDTIVKHRSDKMKEALNKRLGEFKASMESERAQLQQDKERLEADFKLRMEQERKIWETEQASEQREMKVPSTPQQPKAEAAVPTPGTSVPDLNNLGDQEIRELVSKNATVRSIVQNNIKSKLAAEAKKMKEEHEISSKAEWDQKLAQAKESATQLATSKMNLKLNMTENRARIANAKIEVVETAAKETPQRPVGEVWEIAKVAKPPPAVKPAAPTTPATPATPAGRTGPIATTAPTSQLTPSRPALVSQEAKLTPSTTIPPKPVTANAAQQANNPFATSQQSQAMPAVTAANPFSQGGPPVPQPVPTGIPQLAQPSASQIPKVSNLPIPGGARKPSGQQIPRPGARGGGSQRGRGGGHPGRASLNPSADNFQPGAKRPRGDSEIGNGPKRARGGGGPGA